MRKYAMVSGQGTACAETVLSETEYLNPQSRKAKEDAHCLDLEIDTPRRGSWIEVTANCAC